MLFKKNKNWRYVLEFKHKPVLLAECIEGLNIKEKGIYVDGTLGGAGHSKEILKKILDPLGSEVKQSLTIMRKYFSHCFST